jgi:hypothetical protein
MIDFLPKKKIKVVSIGKNKFSGINSYPRTFKVYSTEMDKDGTYKTGLTDSEVKALMELPQFKNKDLSTKPTDEKGSNFWADLEIRLDAKKGVSEFNLEIPMDYIKYKVMLESSKFCNSPLEKQKWPSADWMIIDEEKTAEIEAVEIDFEMEASEIFNSLSEVDRKGMLKLYGKSKLEKASPSLIKSTLFKEMKKDPKRFTKIASDKSLQTRIFLEEMLSLGIIKKKGNYFTNGDDPIGNSTDEAVLYLEDLKNQSVVIALKNKLIDAKKKSNNY